MDIKRSEAKMLDLPELLEQIDDGLVALPEFQRDFDWDQKDVSALLVTVLKGWPAGSLLLMDGQAHFFKVRSLEEGPPLDEDALAYTILDGQQRLTGLYQAIYDEGPYVYAVSADALHEGSVERLDEGVRAFKRADWDERLRGRPWSSDGERWIPMYVLPSASDYFAWRDDVVASVPEALKQETGAELSMLYRDGLETVHKYKFPTVTVEATLEPAAIARIFERVNRTGIRLSTFDLMVAKLYEQDWNLRDLWDRARRDSRLIDEFLGEDGMPILQVIALKYLRNIRESAVLTLEQPLVREQWENAVLATDEALRFFVRRCGVVRSEWLPYRGMIIPIAGLLLDRPIEDQVDLLRKWFWSRSFALSFDAAANTRLVAEYVALQEAVNGDGDISVPPASHSSLFEASRRRQGPIWRAFLSLLAYRDASDLDGTSLGLGEAAEAGEPYEGDVLVTPLFPPGIDTGPESEPAHLRVLNLILAKRGTARRLRDHWASAVVPEVETAADRKVVERALESQFLPPLETLTEIEEEWRPLLMWRMQTLTRFLDEEVGQAVERRETVADAE